MHFSPTIVIARLDWATQYPPYWRLEHCLEQDSNFKRLLDHPLSRVMTTREACDC